MVERHAPMIALRQPLAGSPTRQSRFACAAVSDPHASPDLQCAESVLHLRDDRFRDLVAPEPTIPMAT